MTTISFDRPVHETSVLDIVRDLWPTRPSRRRHYVDVRELPDHLKRDVGILDGSRPVGGVRW